MSFHDLKTWPEPFEAVWIGAKTYEIRENDRNFGWGDLLLLREWAQGCEPEYSGRSVLVRVAYMTPGGKWGLPENLCVMGLKVLANIDDRLPPTLEARP